VIVIISYLCKFNFFLQLSQSSEIFVGKGKLICTQWELSLVNIPNTGPSSQCACAFCPTSLTCAYAAFRRVYFFLFDIVGQQYSTSWSTRQTFLKNAIVVPYKAQANSVILLPATCR